jgi:hypothetical protein
MPRCHRGCSGFNSRLVLHASVMQWVACHPPMVDVAGSSPAWRSTRPARLAAVMVPWCTGSAHGPVKAEVADRYRSGPRNRGVAQRGKRACSGCRRSVVRVHSPRPSWCSSVWRERPFRMREAGGSSPPTETGDSGSSCPGGSDVTATCLPSTQVSAGSSPACRSMHVRRAGVLEGSSSGRTRDFGSRDRGSSPCPSTERARPVGPEEAPPGAAPQRWRWG